ncbi:MAG: hypothetical protein FJ240_00005, partial [Nitrospira sp.]|nr:hypothetical protein [Nitrospira sp.]
MKKVIILCMLLALSFSTYSCGGGGAGSLDSPGGENPGTPSVVKLMPSHYVAQTNSFISLHTKVLDGNGRPVQNTPVTYTNLSNPFGEIISSALKSLGLYKPVGMLSTSVVKTDSFGIATVKLTSTTAGFATIQSEVNTGAGIVRDQKTIFFTTATGSSAPPPPTLKLHVKDATNETYDEPEDFNLLKASGDNTRTVKAVVRDGFGAPFSGVAVTFGSDSPGEVTFDRGTVLTGTGTEAGNAYVVMTVNPAIITKLKRYINISAAADTNGNGTYETGNMLTLFLEPVTVSSITVAANPSVVAPNGTSTIRAVVSLNTGNPTPDGSSVGFTTSCGMVTPFGQTLGGVATATFTAPSIPPSNNICTITASIGGQIGTADVRVTTSLTVQPNTQTINGVIGGIATFTIYGGVAPYTVTSNNIDFPPYLSGNEFTVNVGENSIPRTITYTVRDSIGATVTATLTIAGGASLAVLPSSVTVDSAAPDDTVYFTIFGGVAPYSRFSDNQAYQPIIVSNNQFSILVPAGAPEETVVLTVRDENGDTATAKVDITAVPPQALAVIPASQTIANPAINNAADYTVIGGKAPYSAFSDKPGFATVSVAASTVTALVAAVPTEDTTVTISIYDSLGNRINASLILDLPPLAPLAVIPASQTISNPAGGETADYQVIGGSGGYTAFSSNPAAASVSVAGSVVTATVGTPPTSDTTVTITIYDSAGSSRAATLILDLSPLIPLAVIPASQTISNPAAGNARNYTVLGGTGGYTAFSDNPIVADVAVAG